VKESTSPKRGWGRCHQEALKPAHPERADCRGAEDIGKSGAGGGSDDGRGEQGARHAGPNPCPAQGEPPRGFPLGAAQLSNEQNTLAVLKVNDRFLCRKRMNKVLNEYETRTLHKSSVTMASVFLFTSFLRHFEQLRGKEAASSPRPRLLACPFRLQRSQTLFSWSRRVPFHEVPRAGWAGWWPGESPKEFTVGADSRPEKPHFAPTVTSRDAMSSQGLIGTYRAGTGRSVPISGRCGARSGGKRFGVRLNNRGGGKPVSVPSKDQVMATPTTDAAWRRLPTLTSCPTGRLPTPSRRATLRPS